MKIKLPVIALLLTMLMSSCGGGGSGGNKSASAELVDARLAVPVVDVSEPENAFDVSIISDTNVYDVGVTADFSVSAPSVEIESVSWNNGENEVFSTSTLSRSFIEPGVYTIIADIKSKDGKKARAKKTITIISAAGDIPSVGDANLGDLNHDGVITQADVDSLNALILDSAGITADSQITADINLDDRIDSVDALLLQQMIDEGASWPSFLNVGEAVPGDSVLMASPALLGASDMVITVDERPVRFIRKISGYAVFAVPLPEKVGDKGSFAAYDAMVELRVNDVVREAFTLHINPLPASIPGARQRIKDQLDELHAAIEPASQSVTEYLSNTDDSIESRQAVVVIAGLSASYYTQAAIMLAAAMDDMTDEEIDLIDRYLKHQGIYESSGSLSSKARAKGREPQHRTAVELNDDQFDGVNKARANLAKLNNAADTLGKICGLTDGLSIIGLFPQSKALTAACLGVETGEYFLIALQQFLPGYEDRLEVTAAPGVVSKESDNSEIAIYALAKKWPYCIDAGTLTIKVIAKRITWMLQRKINLMPGGSIDLGGNLDDKTPGMEAVDKVIEHLVSKLFGRQGWLKSINQWIEDSNLCKSARMQLSLDNPALTYTMNFDYLGDLEEGEVGIYTAKDFACKSRNARFKIYRSSAGSSYMGMVDITHKADIEQCPPGPVVQSVTPDTAEIGEPLQINVSGTNLGESNNLQVILEDCQGDSFAKEASTSLQVFECVPDSVGIKKGAVFITDTLNKLFDFTVNVVEPAPLPIITGVSPATVIEDQEFTLNISGENLTDKLRALITINPDIGWWSLCDMVSGGTATERQLSCDAIPMRGRFTGKIILQKISGNIDIEEFTIDVVSGDPLGNDVSLMGTWCEDISRNTNCWVFDSETGSTTGKFYQGSINEYSGMLVRTATWSIDRSAGIFDYKFTFIELINSDFDSGQPVFDTVHSFDYTLSDLQFRINDGTFDNTYYKVGANHPGLGRVVFYVDQLESIIDVSLNGERVGVIQEVNSTPPDCGDIGTLTLMLAPGIYDLDAAEDTLGGLTWHGSFTVEEGKCYRQKLYLSSE